MASKKDKAEERAARAKALLEQQRQQERRRNLMRGGIAVVVLAVVIGVFVYIGQRNGDKVDAAAASVASSYSVTVGPDSAPHKVVIYEDFLCPFCDMLETATRDQLAADVAAGKVQVSYRPFDLLGGGDPSSYSVRAASAFSVVLEKSGATVAKKFHDLLYENQPSEEGPFPDNQALLDLAVKAGADQSAVSDGILNASNVSWVTDATAAADKAKVHSTPTVLLDGRQYGSGEQIPTLAAGLLQAIG